MSQNKNRENQEPKRHYQTLQKTAYKPAWRFSSEIGFGRRWDLFEEDEINELMDSTQEAIDKWGETIGLEFEYEETRSSKFHESEYTKRLDIESKQENEEGEPLIEAKVRYNEPLKVQREGVLHKWKEPDYFEVIGYFNTQNPLMGHSYEKLEESIDSILDEEYRSFDSSEW